MRSKTAELELNAEQSEWLAQQFERLTSEVVSLSPSEWAEQNRYLPPAASPFPGLYRFAVAPYLKEIVDCFSLESPIREVAVMKGVQVCMTTGVLENVIGYGIGYIKSAPMMMITADAELAKLRMETSITPLLQLSGLEHLIKSSDERNARKTGKTDSKIEWVGGGFLIPFGAQNANKLRSIPIQFMLRDEIDGWPDVVGKDGDPIKLSGDRAAAYESSRKVLDISTPLIKGTSKIERRFRLGDQRYYFVCCLRCGFPQTLRWSRTGADGTVSGIVWDTENGNLVPGSTRYLCENCQHPHTDDDKTRLLSPEYGAEWRPTATPVSPDIRSYHLSALYSPVGMQTWDACVKKWLDAWDVERNRSKNNATLQVFYNNVLGETFEVRGEKLRFEQVSPHRRAAYRFGEVPNSFCVQYCGGPVLLLICTVDVHADHLAVAVWGWCRDRRVVLVYYERLGAEKDQPPGNTEQIDDPRTWARLQQMIEGKEYVADDGKRYKITLTVIDSGYRQDDVFRFCEQYQAGVVPIKGAAEPQKGRHREFLAFKTPMGSNAYLIYVDAYKDRWHAALRRSWDGLSLQPDTFFNAPIDTTDKQLNELTVETKREKIDRSTGLRVGYEWHRPSGSANELWDLLMYGNAGLEFVAAEICREVLGLEGVDWQAFYNWAPGAFYTER